MLGFWWGCQCTSNQTLKVHDTHHTLNQTKSVSTLLMYQIFFISNHNLEKWTTSLTTTYSSFFPKITSILFFLLQQYIYLLLNIGIQTLTYSGNQQHTPGPLWTTSTLRFKPSDRVTGGW